MSTDRFTEIINYLSAMSREIGAFRTETNNRLGRLETRMGGLETRMGGLEARMNGLETRMGQLETKMDAGFDEVNGNIRRLRHGLDYAYEQLTDVKLENRYLRKRIEVIEKKVGIEES